MVLSLFWRFVKLAIRCGRGWRNSWARTSIQACWQQRISDVHVHCKWTFMHDAVSQTSHIRNTCTCERQ